MRIHTEPGRVGPDFPPDFSHADTGQLRLKVNHGKNLRVAAQKMRFFVRRS